jgi:uncharacterized membrane protein
LGFVSIMFGALQVSLLSQGEAGAVSDMSNPVYFTMPLPILMHNIFGSLFNLLMPLQFVTQLRAKRPQFHRLMGRFLMVCALGFGISALFMNQVYPQYGGIFKYLGIVTYCVVLIGSLTLGLIAIKQKRVADHRVWMMRMTAAALAPATQRLVIIPAFVIFGEALITDAVIATVIWFGLAVNLLFVEWLINKDKLGTRLALNG